MIDRGHGWWMFGGDNLQALYGYGTSEQADAYQDQLNADREINCYQVTRIDDPEVIGWLDDCNEGFAIGDAIAAIEEERYWAARESLSASGAALVLCRSDAGDGGWSLHRTGTPDEAIADGEGMLLSGEADWDGVRWSRPDDADFAQAMKIAAEGR